MRVYKIIVYIAAFFKLIRLRNLLILALTQFCTRIFLIGNKHQFREYLVEPELYALMSCTLLVAAAGYIINDYYDIKIDMINKPKRVVLGKIFSRRTGLLMHLGLNLVALILAVFALSINVALFVFICQFLLWLYSNALKRKALIGNLTISLLAFASLFIVALYYRENMHRVLYYAVFAFFMHFVREIVKDMEDMEGDAQYNSKTLPIRIGIQKTKLILAFLTVIVLLGLIYSFVILPWVLYVYIMVFVSCPLVYTLYLLFIADDVSDFSRLSSITKMIMVLGIVSMILI